MLPPLRAPGAVTPTRVAEAIIAFLEGQRGADHWLVSCRPAHLRAAAAAASARYARGRPLSALDGVPFAVKDAVDVFGHPGGSGTTFLAKMCAHAARGRRAPGAAAAAAAAAATAAARSPACVRRTT